MSEQTPTTEERIEKLQGLGSARRRVEDARFTQGKGNYVDDIKLPGMVFGDFVRSPYGHARIKGIDKEAALAVPGVLAVLTADDLKPLNLHYMPTLAGDVQAVLADEKVLFQSQEVAFVIAEDRYAAADGVELVEVEYEELPALTDPNRSMSDGAPVLREDIADKNEGAHGPRRHPNHIFTWEAGDRAGTEQALANAEVVAEELVIYQRVHPCPLETCGCVASMDKVNGRLTIWGTFQAPHAVRTVASLITNIPEHNIRIVSPDIGGGFGNKVGVYPGYICAAVASIVLGRPVKWIEDRMENLSATAFARDYHMTGRIAATPRRPDHRSALPRARRPRRVRRLRRPDQVPRRLLQHLHRLVRHPGRPCRGRRRLHQQGPGRRRLPLLVPGHRGVVLHRTHDRRARAQARHGPGGAAQAQLHRRGPVPVHLRARVGVRLGRLPHRDGQGA